MNPAFDMLSSEVSINYHNGDVEQAIGGVNVKGKSEIWGVTIWIIFKTIGQDGSSQGLCME